MEKKDTPLRLNCQVVVRESKKRRHRQLSPRSFTSCHMPTKKSPSERAILDRAIRLSTKEGRWLLLCGFGYLRL
ncbi:hypothetical protein NEUTE1DRAFT_103938 [Neurospora tetrasperma FGSC 2508]|uniref:Uncharacterized protein n=1 Tax=Neurospora tetrasperma (strain FGSC 2508 / ATCC MYA-4615 / P0657) TaxID=510951 RepID=F8MXL9_NEUT8|nr:uncharacterized protein NEUTE1DRAFT_103938 [Neurospora tetrasperma FGSC 2508]EGO54490.1 hypothetical protein NEUTE1DRAFT_103938 [Neurospora tetrasperma FGSC 2508]